MAMQDTLPCFMIQQEEKYFNLLANQECLQVILAKTLSVSGAAISRHLSVLKEAGLIRDEREGKFIYYELIQRY